MSNEEEVSGHDHVGAHLDAGHGHEQENCQGGQDFPSALERAYEEDVDDAYGDGPQIGGPRDQEIIDAAGVLDSASDEELERVGLYRENQQIVSYSGQLPPPNIFYAFEEDVRERMCRWVDSFTVDESARQDRALDETIKNSNRSQYFNFVFNGAIVVLTFVAFLMTGDAAAFLGFLLPGISVISNVYIEVKGGKEEKPPADD